MYVYPLIPTPKPAEAQLPAAANATKNARKPKAWDAQQFNAGAHRAVHFILDLLFHQFPAVFTTVQLAMNKEFLNHVPSNA